MLLDMEDREGDEGATSFNHNNSWNIDSIGVMTRTTNSFLESQMKAKSSEAVYTPQIVDVYDTLVWDFNSPFHWRIQLTTCTSVGSRDRTGTARSLLELDYSSGAGQGRRSMAKQTSLSTSHWLT